MKAYPLSLTFFCVLYLLVAFPSLADENVTSEVSSPEPVDAHCPVCEPCEPCGDDEKDPTAWDRSLAAGFNLTDGNSNTTLFTVTGSAEREIGKNIWRFDAQHSFGQDEDNPDMETNVDQTNAHGQYKRLVTERLYYGFGTEFRRDEIADLKYRVWANPAVGYFLYKNDTVKFNVEAGPSYVFEEQGGVANDYLAPRVGERLEFEISDTAKIFEEVFATFDAEDSDNYIIQARAGIETTITEVLSLVISIQDNYDNVPAEDRKRNDIITLTTLSYNF